MYKWRLAIRLLRRMNTRRVATRLLKRIPFVEMPRPACELKSCGCHESSFTWVSNQHEYVWFETPKCASSSLKSMLPDAERSLLPSRFRRRSDYTRFGVVRNPWAKMVSNYAMFIERDDAFRNGQIEALFGVSRREVTFDRFLDLAERIPNHHWAECYEYFPHRTDGSVDLDYVIRLESFSNDIQAVGEKIDVSFDVRHQNYTDHKPYQKYYKKDTRQKVEKMFSKDIEHFEYYF